VALANGIMGFPRGRIWFAPEFDGLGSFDNAALGEFAEKLIEIGLKLLAGDFGKALGERVEDFPAARLLLEVLPNDAANRVQAEAEALLNIQEDGAFLIDHGSYAIGGDRRNVLQSWHVDSYCSDTSLLNSDLSEW
jgi:hypothetical protein